MEQVLAIRHVAFEDLGVLDAVLAERGCQVRYVEAPLGQLSEVDPMAADLVVVLGGPIGAYEEQAYPFLLDELRLLEKRLAAGRPTLGLCLGSQLMARALGARVYAGDHKEIGWSPLALTEDGVRSPLRHLGVDDNGAVLHWHGDTFDLPDGAVRLASTPLYENQAFAYGPNALGLQFHPEVTARGLEAWFVGHAFEIGATPGVSAQQLRADTRQWAPVLERQGRLCMEQWLDQLAS